MGIGTFAHISARLVIVHDLNVRGAFGCPPEAHAELVIDADAMQPGKITFECLQPVAWRDAQIIEPASTVQHGQFAHGHRFNVHKPLDSGAVEQALCICVLERFNRHDGMLTNVVSIVNRQHGKAGRHPGSGRKKFHGKLRRNPENISMGSIWF